MSRPTSVGAGPRILVVSPMASHPANQGNSLRLLAFNRELMRRGSRIDLVYYGMEGLTPESEAAMRAAWNDFIFVPSRPLGRPSYATHWGIDDWCSDALCEAVERLTAERRYDAVVVNYSWMSRVLEFCDGPVKVLDTHDVFAGRRDKMVEAGLDPRWFFTSVAQEREAFARADIVIGIQEAESGLIAEHCAGRVLTVGHPLALDFLLEEAGTERPLPFGYFASGNPWNKRSALALDAALATRPFRNWAIAGTICDSRLRLRTAPLELGRVAHPREFYDHVDCVVNPMIGGTGLKIKTIEALSHGRSVIGTTAAFEGLRPAHPFHRFASAEALAEGMQDLARDPALRDEVARASRTLAVAYAGAVAAQFDMLIASIEDLAHDRRSQRHEELA
ncbi:conserved hypothetical protein [Methylobacterium sp. 4-46]|uniref:glycosyltransferase n=1 Tax=unclassified Methylobacterium TaxID=2615210 RepID=UPI000152BE28|nr:MULTISPECIES: glycosyltransferase family 4 protein [Methylobacterium]ACA18354.1 conserved hypothetical protein [Methylobacterium sp. 4-46]WFT77651.1 glycosyltransferase family 4 protein [Methylobacterium nodulans]